MELLGPPFSSYPLKLSFCYQKGGFKSQNAPFLAHYFNYINKLAWSDPDSPDSFAIKKMTFLTVMELMEHRGAYGET
jgi:hypothetical protein